MTIIDPIAQQFDKLPPHSVESEMCLIGSMMLFGDDDAAHATAENLIAIAQQIERLLVDAALTHFVAAFSHRSSCGPPCHPGVKTPPLV